MINRAATATNALNGANWLGQSSVIYGITVAAVVVATLIRWLIDPILGDHLPYPTYFIAVAVAAWLGGLRPALLATLLGLLAVVVFFIPPRLSPTIPTGPHLLGLLMYLVVCITFATFGEVMRRSQRRLAERGERLRTTLASIGDAVITTDVDGNITNLNAVAESLTGWTNAEAINQSLDSVFRIVNEITRKVVESPVIRALREGVIVGLANHTILIAKDGAEHHIDDSAAPIRCREGEIVGCVLIFRDIGEQRELQRQASILASIVHFSDDAIISKSLDGVIQSWNAAAERLFGYTAREAIGRPISIVIPPDRISEEEQFLAQLRLGNRIEQVDTVRIRNDGNLLDVELTISPICNESGEVIGASKIVRDVTPRKREEAAQAERTRLISLRAEVSMELSLANSTSAALQKCCEAMVRQLDVAFARIWTLDGSETVLEMQASAGLYTHLDGPHSRVPVGQYKIGRIASTRQPHLTNSVPNDPQVSDREWAAKAGMIAFAGYPLIVEDRVVGVVAMFSRKAMTENVLTELAPLANGIAQFIDRRRSEALLQQQAELSKTTLASIGDAVITTDIAGNVTQLNPVAETLTGWTNNEAGGQPLDTVFHIVNESTRQPVHNPAFKALREGVIVGLANHTILIAKDRTERPIDDSAAPIRNSSGEIVGCVLVFRDIADRKHAEQKMEEAQSRLKSTLDAAEIGTWEFNITTNSVRADQNLARMFGVTPDEAEGGPLEVFTRAIHPDDRDRVGIAIGQALETGNSFESEYRVVDAEGAIRWVIARGRVQRNDEGKALRLPGVVVDITRQKSVEEELRASESRRRIALDSAELGAWNIDPAANLLISDERFQMVFNGTVGPMTFEEAFALIHPDDRERIRSAVEAATRPGNPAPYTEEYRVVHPSGNIRWVFAKGRANFEGDRLTSFDGTVADITERKRSEELIRESEHRLRFILDSMPQKVFTATSKGEVDYFNPVWMEFTGLSFEEIRDWGWTAFVHPDDVEENVRLWKNAIATGQPFQFEHRFRQVDGEYRWHMSRAKALKDEEGKIVMWVGANTDIHDQRRTADELRNVAAKLSEADHRKDEFLAILAHELRNPLAPLRNGLQVMKLAKDDADAVEQSRKMMERQLDQMVRLVDDLMDVSRISRGKLELKVERVELATVLQSAIETNRPLLNQMGHKLTLALPNEVVIIEADFTRLAQVFLNLLNNAAKYSDHGGQIDVAVEKQDNEVIVFVTDSGIGITAEHLVGIFEMFSQVDQSLEKSQGGLGIGLTLVKRLVEMHGGSVTAQSEGIDKGSQFVVRLPIASEKPSHSSGNNDEPNPEAKSSKRILVVDDNRDSANSLALMLKIMGNETRTAYDGEEAIATVKQFLPEVILLDIGLPKLNGYEACRRIKNQPWGKDIVVIAQTGWGQDDDRIRTKEAGFDYHLVKPVEPTSLMKLLSELSISKSKE